MRSSYILAFMGLTVILSGIYLDFIKVSPVIIGVLFGSGTTILSTGIIEIARFYENTSPIEIELSEEDEKGKDKEGKDKIITKKLSLLITNIGNNIIEDSKGTIHIWIQRHKGEEPTDKLEKIRIS